MEKADIIVIGAGAVGLAVASVLSRTRQNASVIVVERNDSFGREASSRNSEVIHAGIYYPPGSLKARLCVRGKALLYEFLQEHAVPYKKLGKLIVAADAAEKKLLDALFERALKNGVDDVHKMSAATVAEFEPEIAAYAALFSPSTGIFDTHSYMKTLETISKKRGVIFAYGCEVMGITKTSDGYELLLKDSDGSDLTLGAGVVVNCAGLGSDQIAALAGIDIDAAGYRLHLSKGEYFRVQGLGRWLINHLVYPVPGPTSLGIHTVLDLEGGIRLGPNAFYVDTIDYSVNPAHADDFFAAAKRILPFVRRDALSPDMSGIRAKLQKPGEEFRDFVIVEESARGLSGLVNCVGIESPGLTGSLAIAEYVETLL